jgi:hypothetical protein
MEQVHVREANGEVLIFLDKNMGDRLNALEEANKIIQRELLRERVNASRNAGRKPDSNELPGG